MEVKLIAITPNAIDVIHTACRTCYSENEPSELFRQAILTTKADKLDLMQKVWSSGHTSTAEHVYFTFAVSGVSRALLAQLSRHRFISLSVQSQRYVNMQNCDFLVTKSLDKMQHSAINNVLVDIKTTYSNLVDSGVKKEDARAILPNATCTNLIMSMNLRELMHVCNLRLCTRAQKEIREMFAEIVSEVVARETWLKPYLVPQCEKLNYCPEHKSCGRRKTLKELLSGN